MVFTKKLLGVFLIVTSLVLTGQGCGGNNQAEQLATEQVELDIWRVVDGEDAFDDIITDYQTIHPNVSVNYRRLRLDEYEDELVNAFARGEGPDIFSVHNTWMGEYEDLILPLPESLTIPYTEIEGTIKKERVTTLREERSITKRQLRERYVDVVAHDVIRTLQRPDGTQEERIMGLPMAVDTLAMFYNKDLFNAAGIAVPPQTWEQFQTEVVPSLTQISEEGNIIQSGAAIGTAENVERYFDILSLLMMQGGTEMVDRRGRAAFAEENENNDLPGVRAVQFYTNFANPAVQNYTWNADQANSLEAFVNGETAIFFGYSYHIPIIRSRNENLNFAITQVPQITDNPSARKVNYANYWVETVAQSTEHDNWAWDFVQFASEAEQARSYLDEAQRPTALRGLIEGQLENEDLSPFANQLLTAKSWYVGDDAAVAEEAFMQLIEDALAGREVVESTERAQNQVNQTL